MRSFKRIGRTVVFAAALGLGTLAVLPAAAQLQPFVDYQISDSVIEMTTINVEPGEFETYLEGLRATWFPANALAKRLGHIEDYAMYVNEYGDGDSFDIILVVEMADTSDLAPNRERYEAFMAEWGEQRNQQSERTVREVYNEIREIQGTYLLREVTLSE